MLDETEQNVTQRQKSSDRLRKAEDSRLRCLLTFGWVAPPTVGLQREIKGKYYCIHFVLCGNTKSEILMKIDIDIPAIFLFTIYHQPALWTRLDHDVPDCSDNGNIIRIKEHTTLLIITRDSVAAFTPSK